MLFEALQEGDDSQTEAGEVSVIHGRSSRSSCRDMVQEQGDVPMPCALRSLVCTCGPSVEATCYELPLK